MTRFLVGGRAWRPVSKRASGPRPQRASPRRFEGNAGVVEVGLHLQGSDQGGDILALLGGDNRDHDARCPGPTGATRPVDVVLGVAGGSKCTTHATSRTWMPRAATSVATSPPPGRREGRERRSRWACAAVAVDGAAATPACAELRAMRSAPWLVRQNTIVRPRALTTCRHLDAIRLAPRQKLVVTSRPRRRRGRRGGRQRGGSRG